MGLMGNSLSYIFQNLPPNARVSVQFYEIYNDNIFDLIGCTDLANSSIEQNFKPQQCKVSITKERIQIVGLSTIVVATEAETQELIQLAMSRRKTSATILNDTSSRSHAIFQIHVSKMVDGQEVVGSLTLCDLAGSEQIQNADIDPQRKQESIFINLSLSSLSNVFVALHSKTFVQYRDSKLTQCLQEYFQGDSKAVMIVCLNEDAACYSESVNSLKFAQRVKGVSLTQKK